MPKEYEPNESKGCYTVMRVVFWIWAVVYALIGMGRLFDYLRHR